MSLLPLSIGFLLGALTILAAEVLGLVFLIVRLKQRAKAVEAKATSHSSSHVLGDLNPSYPIKQGAVWVLEPEKVPKTWSADKFPQDQKRENIVEVTPVKKYAKIRNRILFLSEIDGSVTEIRLKGCKVTAVSATNLSSRKW